MATRKQQVYVFVNTWKDRHGEEGMNVKVFGDKKSADRYFAADLRNYLSERDALVGDNEKIDTDALESFEAGDISTDECTLGEFQKAAMRAGWAEVNADGSGTYASWSVSRDPVL